MLKRRSLKFFVLFVFVLFLSQEVIHRSNASKKNDEESKEDSAQQFFRRFLLEKEESSSESESEEEEEEEEDESPTGLRFRTTTYVILTVLIALSVAFELFKDAIEERTSEEMDPIMNHLWQELTILGFLSLLSFLAVKSGVFDHISKKIFEEKEELSELVETVHMLLFFVMLVFIVEVLMLLAISSRIEKEWHDAEKAAKNPEKVISDFKHDVQEAGICMRMLSIFPYFDPNYIPNHRYEFLQLRQEFMNPRHALGPKPGKDFNFAAYLAFILGETVGELVEIPWFSWFILDLIFLGFWAITALSEDIVMYLYLSWGYILVAVLFLIARKLDWCRSMLLPKTPAQRAADSIQISDNTPLLNDETDPTSRNRRVGFESSQEDAPGAPTQKGKVNRKMSMMPIYTMSAPDFLEQKIEPRSSIGHFFLGPPPNQHQSLFWFDKKGKSFILLLLRMVMILTAIYIALLSYHFAKYFLDKGGILFFLLLLAVCIVPLLLFFYYVPYILRRMVLVFNIEMMKSKEVIKKVMRIEKTKSSFRILKTIQLIKLNSSQGVLQKLEPGASGTPELSQHDRTHFKEVFALFDTDNSGAIASSELQSLLETLGMQMDEIEAQAIITKLDQDDDGLMNLDEFLSLMSALQTQDENFDEDESIEQMFKMFDKDGSGEITADEFRSLLNTLGQQMTNEDIDAIIDEIDEDSSGEISIEEFKALLKKHMDD